MRGLIILGATAALMATGPAAAQTKSAAQTLKEFGLIGEWSPDCRKPASQQNTRSIFEAQPDGTVKLTFSFGTEGEIVYSIGKARVLSKQIAVISQTNAQGLPSDVTVTIDGKRTRVLASRDPSINQTFIAAGVLLSSRKPTTWDARCK